jgi:hypothetical protein
MLRRVWGQVSEFQEDQKQASTPAAKRKPGRLKGSPKVPGSGRKVGTPNHAVDPAETARTILGNGAAFRDTFSRLGHIATGQPIVQHSSTGKRYSGPAPIKAQVQAAAILLGKVIGDKTETNVQAEVSTTVHAHADVRTALIAALTAEGLLINAIAAPVTSGGAVAEVASPGDPLVLAW